MKTKFVKTRVNLTSSQLKRIEEALHSHMGVTLRLNSSHVNSAAGNSHLILTENQYNKLHDNRTHNISIPYTRLHQMHVGGFLPLLAAIPAILGALGGLGGLAGGIATAVNQGKQAARVGSGFKRKFGGCAGNPMLLGRDGRGRPPIL